MREEGMQLTISPTYVRAKTLFDLFIACTLHKIRHAYNLFLDITVLFHRPLTDFARKLLHVPSSLIRP